MCVIGDFCKCSQCFARARPPTASPGGCDAAPAGMQPPPAYAPRASTLYLPQHKHTPSTHAHDTPHAHTKTRVRGTVNVRGGEMRLPGGGRYGRAQGRQPHPFKCEGDAAAWATDRQSGQRERQTPRRELARREPCRVGGQVHVVLSFTSVDQGDMFSPFLFRP